MTESAHFERAGMIRFLDEGGAPVRDLPDFARSRDELVRLYAALVRTRAFDAKAIALQRTGRLGTYGSCLGQEAIGIGVASAMTADDVLLPSFREHGGQMLRGVTMEELFLFWGGDERGNAFAHARSDFPVCIPVGTQFPHAAGVALAMQQKGERGVAVAVGGDGGTSKGDFYEAMNLAGVWKLPAVFVINNNQWAISVRRAEQTAAKTLAQKAVAAGLPGVIADGNDVIAVRDVMARSLGWARAGKGATLIECVTYRLGDHTTADDAGRYRGAEEVSPHWKAEPIVRLRSHLAAAHGWTKEEEEALLRACKAEAEEAAGNYLAIAPDAPRAMFDHLYAELPAAIASQAEEVSDG